MRTKLSILGVGVLPKSANIPAKNIDKYFKSKKGVIRDYSVGTKVLVRRGKGDKFCRQGKIVRGISPTTYKVRFLSGLESTHNQFNMKKMESRLPDEADGLAAGGI